MPISSLYELFPDFEPRGDVKVWIVDREVDSTYVVSLVQNNSKSGKSGK